MNPGIKCTDMQRLDLNHSSNSYATRRSRRSHRKSRLGCKNCKTRRIKCDENEPSCHNCASHAIECDYSAAPRRLASSTPGHSDSTSVPRTEFSFISSSQSDFTPPKRAHGKNASLQASPLGSESAIAHRPFQFTATDMALFHHCLSAEDLKDHIPQQLIQLGFSAHYVLRLLLAISAFHLKRTATDDSLHQVLGPGVDLAAEAERHLGTAIAEVASADSNLHPRNFQSLYIASCFIFVCSLARGPHRDEYLAFRNDDDIPALSLFLGVRSILEASNDIGISHGASELHLLGEQGDHVARGSEPAQRPDVPPSHTASRSPWAHYESLEELRLLVLNTFPLEDTRHTNYISCLDLLSQRYNSILGASDPLPGSQLWPEIFSWLYMLPDAVVHDMQRRQPLALLLLSYFCVLLNQLDSVWFVHRWPGHIVRGVYESLDEFHRGFLRWPLSQLNVYNL